MAKLNLILSVLFFILAVTSAAELQMKDVDTEDLLESVPTFNPLIELPQEDQETTVVFELPEPTESTEDLTTVHFRTKDDDRHNGPRGKRLHHGHLHSHDKGSNDVEEEKQERWVRFHQHGEHEFGDSNGSDMMEIVSENDDVERPDHHRHNHHRFETDDDEKREGRRQRFERNEDEEREGHHYHRHHGHRHHHHDEEDHEEEGGVVMKMRKFLMSRF